MPLQAGCWTGLTEEISAWTGYQSSSGLPLQLTGSREVWFLPCCVGAPWMNTPSNRWKWGSCFQLSLEVSENRVSAAFSICQIFTKISELKVRLYLSIQGTFKHDFKHAWARHQPSHCTELLKLWRFFFSFLRYAPGHRSKQTKINTKIQSEFADSGEGNW